MSQVSDQDVAAMREWLAKEPHLPKNFSDQLLRKFIYSCFCSLEKTKKCIEKFCANRRNMPEIYTNRDPASVRLQNAFASTYVTAYCAGVDEILIHQLKEFTDKFDFYGILAAFAVNADHWLKIKQERMYEGHIIILDIKEYSLLLVTKVNVFYFQRFLIYLLESMPVRLKQIHVVNCPSFTEYLYNLVKSALPEEIRNMIKFHTTNETLHDHIDKKFLPKEYGGEAPDMGVKQEEILKEIINDREFYQNNELWMMDLTKKTKSSVAENTMNGTFRSLAID